MKKSAISLSMIAGNWKLPENITIIDVVTTKNYPLGAVLVQYNTTGLYGLWSSGISSPVDQKEAQAYINAIHE